MGLKTSYNGFGPKIRDESFVWQKREMAEGRLPGPTRCDECGETRGHLDYHTEDYSKPFGPHIYAHMLCFRCHMALHGRFRNPDMWRGYMDLLEAGAVYEPLWTRREIGKVWVPGWVARPVSMGPARRAMTFFRSLAMTRPEVNEQDDPKSPFFLI